MASAPGELGPRGIEINRAVGQPVIDQRGVHAPTPLHQPRPDNHTGRNLVIAGVAVATVGTAAFLATIQGAGNGNPDVTHAPGGAVQKTDNPSFGTQLPSQGEVSFVPKTQEPSQPASQQPTPSTSAPETTQSPEPTPYAWKSLSKVPLTDLPKVTPAQIKALIIKAYANDPKAEDIWKESVALEMLYEMQFGTPGDPKQYIPLDRQSAAYAGIMNLNQIYLKTQDENFYTASLDFWSYTVKNIPNAKEFIEPKLS